MPLEYLGTLDSLIIGGLPRVNKTPFKGFCESSGDGGN